MNIITGASGQIGSMIVKNLRADGAAVRGIVRSQEKAVEVEKSGAEAFIADILDRELLIQAFQGGKALLLMTPEDPADENQAVSTKTLLDNYRLAIKRSSVQKIVGLSSMGAHLTENSGGLYLSYLLEQHFIESEVEQVFIRPAFYFSNWLMYYEQAIQTGTLSTFYDPEVRIPMIAPPDVASLAARLMPGGPGGNKIYEVEGPARYAANDVAAIFSEISGKEIKAVQIPREEWAGVLGGLGFSADATRNMIEMTDTVNNGTSGPVKEGTVWLQTETSLESYLKAALTQPGL